MAATLCAEPGPNLRLKGLFALQEGGGIIACNLLFLTSPKLENHEPHAPPCTPALPPSAEPCECGGGRILIWRGGAVTVVNPACSFPIPRFCSGAA